MAQIRQRSMPKLHICEVGDNGGSFWRNALIHEEWWRADLNENLGFKVYYYGVGTLNPVPPPQPPIPGVGDGRVP